MKEIQNSPDIKWNNLEDEIDNAINKDNPYIDFEIREIEECKYIQKIAEAKLSKLNNTNTRIIFLAAFGFSLMIPFIYENISSVILIGFFIGIGVISYSIYYDKKVVRKQYNTCNKIILNAERKIL
ncbi:MAG: hypothetical protein KKA10_17675 [Euryarchaeota archaeon]|nr:hypothetical protein [Euryarchaeota archaeon]MCG2736505.1 hypothetical protein [Candidatus Methanoperedenaceae archaeon]